MADSLFGNATSVCSSTNEHSACSLSDSEDDEDITALGVSPTKDFVTREDEEQKSVALNFFQTLLATCDAGVSRILLSATCHIVCIAVSAVA